jgi:hypothetical protein
MTPNFPGILNSQIDCECELKSVGQILIRLVNLKLQKEDYNCKQAYLESRENFNSASRFCGYLESRSIFGSGLNRIKLTLSTKEINDLNRGAWLEILSSPTHQYIDINCNPNKPKFTTVNTNQLNKTNNDLAKKLTEIQDLLNRTFSERNLKNILLNANSSLVENLKDTVGGIINRRLMSHTSTSRSFKYGSTTPDELELAMQAVLLEYEKKNNLSVIINNNNQTKLEKNISSESDKEWIRAIESINNSLDELKYSESAAFSSANKSDKTDSSG